jgi:hypothetical protein
MVGIFDGHAAREARHSLRRRIPPFVAPRFKAQDGLAAARQMSEGWLVTRAF